MSTDDWQLLRAYVAEKSHQAFGLLVGRYLGLVFATARRSGCDLHLAEDVAQAVFMVLSRKAGTIRQGSPLSLWLHQTTRYTAANALKMNRTRRRHEEMAAAMNPDSIELDKTSEDDRSQQALALLMEQAVGQLKPTDRAAVLLRFYQGRTFAEVATSLGSSPHAVEMRISRAIEKLRRYFKARGSTLQAAGIMGQLSMGAVISPPVSLGANVLGAVFGKSASALAIALAARVPRSGWMLVTTLGAAMAMICALLFIWLSMPPKQAHTPIPEPSISAPLAEPATQIPPPSTQPVIVISGFENSPPLTVDQISPEHVSVRLTKEPQVVDHQFFMFRVDNVRGRTIQIDFHGVVLSKWFTLNPVYSYNLNHDGSSTSEPVQQPASPINSGLVDRDEIPLPDTRSQDWHYIAKTWPDGTDTFCFSQSFTNDSVLIAMRPPYLSSGNEAYFNKLGKNPLVKVVEIGRTREKRPLLMARIGNPGQEKTNPCVMVYAGEHADDEDGMWAARGMIDHLLEDTETARALRKHFTFLIIPMLDPDASANCIHQRLMIGFKTDTMSAETIAYANWFANWIDSGNRLDLAIDLGNVQSAEGANCHCAWREALGDRGRAADLLNKVVFRDLSAAGYSVSRQLEKQGWTPARLGGWLARRYGPVSMLYMLNSQAPNRHLNMEQLRTMGGTMLDAMPEFFDSPQADAMVAGIDQLLRERAERFAKHSPLPGRTDAITAESIVSKGLFLWDGTNTDTVEYWIDANPWPPVRKLAATTAKVEK